MVLSALLRVFKNAQYVLIAVGTTFLVFTLAVWLPNVKLIVGVLSSPTASLLEKIRFVISLYGSIATNFTIVSASYTIVIAILFGMNIALLTYYIKTQQSPVISSGVATSAGGLVSGIFGIGCAACGTFLLTPILTLFGAGGILGFLPFGGEEFGFIGVGLLLYSIYMISKKIAGPIVCKI